MIFISSRSSLLFGIEALGLIGNQSKNILPWSQTLQNSCPESHSSVWGGVLLGRDGLLGRLVVMAPLLSLLEKPDTKLPPNA
jgi:hypothetical protein